MVSYKTSRETDKKTLVNLKPGKMYLGLTLKKLFMKRKVSKSHLMKVRGFIKKTER